MVDIINVERVIVLGGDMLRHSRQIGTLSSWIVSLVADLFDLHQNFELSHMWSLHPLDADFHVWHLESRKSLILLSNTIHTTSTSLLLRLLESKFSLMRCMYKCTQRSKILSEKCTVLRSWPNDLWNSKESVPRPSTSCCASFNVWEI